MADSVERSSQRYGAPSAVVTRVLVEKATGLSDLEVAAKLMLAEWAVRRIVRQHGRLANATLPRSIRTIADLPQN